MLSGFKVYYDCEPGKNQVCNKTGHVICKAGYYGDDCLRYCNSTMFENCNCTEEGDLRCSKQPVGVFFDVQFLSKVVSGKHYHVFDETVFIRQSYNNNTFREVIYPLQTLAKNTTSFYYPSYNSFTNAVFYINITKKETQVAEQTFHLDLVSPSRDAHFADYSFPGDPIQNILFKIKQRLVYNCKPSTKNHTCNKRGNEICKENLFGRNCDIFCNTDQPHQNCFLNGTRQCDENYFGENCDVFCHVKASHGNCSQNGTVQCNINFFGEQCDTFCNTSMTHGNCSRNGTQQCDENYFGENCDVFCHVKAPRGNCSQNGTVQCNVNFFGEQCDNFCNTSMTHGNCSQNGTRQCEINYFGENCDVFCHVKAPRGNCSQNGTVQCNINFFGEQCETFCNTSMAHGNCSQNGTQQCDENYFGENCDVFCM
uniref:Delta-like protein n=1 Tax=Crassostrea virginica TaxID=6565 RepID=A0A8B8B5M6_CRAVI|nr:scavenger receptor class F member 2-like [Crassostrea virginica]